jgi:LPS sulfotransferase NodH
LQGEADLSMDKYYHLATRNILSRFIYGLFNEYLAYAFSNIRPSKYSQHNKFIIYAQGRTGSTLLVNSLNSHPLIFCEREILMDKNLPFDHQVANYQKMLRGKSSIFRSRVYGFKVKIYQLTEQHDIKCPVSFLEYAHNNGWKILYLYRENVFEHVLSNCVAEELGQYHFSKKSNKVNYSKLKLNLDCDSLISRMNERVQYKKDEELSMGDIPHMTIKYEDLSTNIQSVCSTIYNYLGIENYKTYTEIQKTNTKRYSDLIVNIDEVIKKLREANLEKYINYDRI